MRDHAGTAGIVDEDVEPALGGVDRGGEAFDGERVLRRRAARSVADARQAGNQPVGRLGIVAKGDDDTRPRLRQEACGRGSQALAAARHQRYPFVEHAHDLSVKAIDTRATVRYRDPEIARLVWHSPQLKLTLRRGQATSHWSSATTKRRTLAADLLQIARQAVQD